MSSIGFGADGWRGIVAEEFTFASVAIVAQAVAAFLQAHEKGKQGVLVACEDDVLGPLFAERVAEVLAGNGVPVWLSDGLCGAEQAAEAVMQNLLAGAVRVTATVGPDGGGGIAFQMGRERLTAERAKEIACFVRDVEAGAISVRVTPYARAVRQGMIRLQHGLCAGLRV